MTHIKKIHEGFSNGTAFHDLMGHFDIPFSNTTDNEYTYYSKDNTLNSRGYDLDMQANNSVNIQSDNGTVNIAGGEGATVSGKGASMTMKDSNLN